MSSIRSNLHASNTSIAITAIKYRNPIIDCIINGEYIAQPAIAMAKCPKKHGDLFYTVYTVKKNTFLFLKNPG